MHAQQRCHSSHTPLPAAVVCGRQDIVSCRLPLGACDPIHSASAARLTEFLASLSAPASSRACTTWAWPLIAAQCSGVSPSCTAPTKKHQYQTPHDIWHEVTCLDPVAALCARPSHRATRPRARASACEWLTLLPPYGTCMLATGAGHRGRQRRAWQTGQQGRARS